MRTFRDRVRHTIIFEVVALLLMATAGSWFAGRSALAMGVMSLMFSVIVMAWNLVFNWLFDTWEQRYRPGRRRGVALRVTHAVLFEAGLVLVGIFVIAWWLDMTLWQALVLDLGFALFFAAYAFAYNWAYDVVFPLPARA